MRRSSAGAGYEPIETPAFEDTELFERGVGRSTDIVRKEMFTFEDKGGRSVTLRPEGTAPICRAYLEHGMHKLAQPVKLWYAGPFFRHERPQAGRYRQFHQVGAEAIGSDSPLADAEVIMLLADLLDRARRAGRRAAARQPRLARTRARAYLEELKAHLRANEGELSKEVRERIDLNPLRAFDADDEGTQGGDGERADDRRRLDGEDAEHFAEVRALLDAAGVAVRDRPDPGARPRLLHPHDLLLRLRPARRAVRGRRRRPLRRPDRAARRAADPGRRLGGGDRAHPAGDGRGERDDPCAMSSSPQPTTTSGGGR